MRWRGRATSYNPPPASTTCLHLLPLLARCLFTPLAHPFPPPPTPAHRTVAIAVHSAQAHGGVHAPVVRLLALVRAWRHQGWGARHGANTRVPWPGALYGKVRRRVPPPCARPPPVGATGSSAPLCQPTPFSAPPRPLPPRPPHLQTPPGTASWAHWASRWQPGRSPCPK